MAKKNKTQKTEAPKKKTETKEKKEEAPAEETKEEPYVDERRVYKKIKVNFWRTRLHEEELGVYQSLKYQAKTRYFSKNFEIEGLVEIDDKKKYIIAYNKDVWEENPIEKKRLVCRLFTIMEEKMGMGKGGSFKGGIELSITHSLIQSYEIKHPANVFFVQVPRTNMLARIVSGWRFIGTRWTFPLLPEQTDDRLQMIMAKGVVGPGKNYNIFLGEKKIAKIDGQPIQKEFEIEIYEEDYAKDKYFVMILTLFGVCCNFMKDAKKIIKKFYKQMKTTGTTEYKPPKPELDLFKNPRMMRK